MPTTFVFVRHAEGTHNVKNDYNNVIHKDATLTDLGYTQIKERVTEGVPEFNSFDAVFCSPLRRCRLTLEGLYPESINYNVIVDDKLIEQPQGYHVCNMRVEKAALAIDVPGFWDLSAVTDTNPYVFDVELDKLRLANFTNYVKNNYEGKKVLVVSHCTWIHNWLAMYKNKSGIWLKNCEFIVATV
jgi:broad specificity phosphatase PhoE